MWSVERLKLFVVVMIAVSLMNVLADVSLAAMHAGINWYYGVAYFLTMLGVFRVMLPGLGIPRRYTEIPPPEQKSASADQASDQHTTFASHTRAGDDQVESGALRSLARLRIDVRIKAERGD
jgi:hypothetical protein